jgi:hypothetical protein
MTVLTEEERQAEVPGSGQRASGLRRLGVFGRVRVGVATQGRLRLVAVLLRALGLGVPLRVDLDFV